MAKVFRTETLSLSDNIRLASSEAGAFEIKSAGGSTLMSKATIESDISSLQAQRVIDESDTNTEVSSLQAADVKNESDLSVDISSLQAQRVIDESDTNTEVSSLQAADVKNESDLSVDVSSLNAAIASNDVVAISSSVNNGSDNSGSIAFGRTFASTPVVVALMRSTDANDPIISCMVSAVSTSAATVTFADTVPSANYTVELIASIG
jgi:hypothetical protein